LSALFEERTTGRTAKLTPTKALESSVSRLV
jgi:hypothetical protein